LEPRRRLALGALLGEASGVGLVGDLGDLLLGLGLVGLLLELLEDLVLVEVAVLVGDAQQRDRPGLEVRGRALDGESELLRQGEKLLRLRFHFLREFVQPQAASPRTRRARAERLGAQLDAAASSAAGGGGSTVSEEAVVSDDSGRAGGSLAPAG